MSYWRYVRYVGVGYVRSSDVAPGWGRTLHVDLNDGQLSLYYLQFRRESPPRDRLTIYWSYPDLGIARDVLWVGIPLWFPTLLFLILPAVWLRRFRSERRKRREGLCRSCGYDLRAHSPGQLCPECGTTVPADLVRKPMG